MGEARDHHVLARRVENGHVGLFVAAPAEGRTPQHLPVGVEADDQRVPVGGVVVGAGDQHVAARCDVEAVRPTNGVVGGRAGKAQPVEAGVLCGRG